MGVFFEKFYVEGEEEIMMRRSGFIFFCVVDNFLQFFKVQSKLDPLNRTLDFSETNPYCILDVQQGNFKILQLPRQVLIHFLVEKWIPPSGSKTTEIGQKNRRNFRG
jgi:hypothetical protein